MLHFQQNTICITHVASLMLPCCTYSLIGRFYHWTPSGQCACRAVSLAVPSPRWAAGGGAGLEAASCSELDSAEAHLSYLPGLLCRHGNLTGAHAANAITPLTPQGEPPVQTAGSPAVQLVSPFRCLGYILGSPGPALSWHLGPSHCSTHSLSLPRGR